MRKSPLDVSNAVRAWLRSQQISVSDAAVRLGKTPQAVTNALAGAKYMGKRLAADFHAAFGFDELFLTTGYGTLTGEPEGAPAADAGDGVITIHPGLAQLMTSMAETIRAQQDAIAAQQQNIVTLTRLVMLQLQGGGEKDAEPAQPSAHAGQRL